MTVVRLQHQYYGQQDVRCALLLRIDTCVVPLALATGFLLPPVIGLAWGDPWGAFIYAGLVSRLLSMSITRARLNSADCP